MNWHKFSDRSGLLQMKQKEASKGRVLALKLPFTERTGSLKVASLAHTMQEHVRNSPSLAAKFKNTRLLVAHKRTANIQMKTRCK